MSSHRCKDVLPVAATVKCNRHICKRPKGHAEKHVCKCGVTWLFVPKEPDPANNPFIEPDSPNDLGVFGPGLHFKPGAD